MPLNRIPYRHLPTTVRIQVEDVTGSIIAATSVGAGLNSSVATLLHTSTGRYFAKALLCDHRWAWTQAREAEIAAHVRPVAPRLHARIVAEGWDVLVFEAFNGHHADYAPGSADLPQVAALIARIAELPRPDIALREAGQRLQAYAEPTDLPYFAGDALLHTDLNNANVIIGEDSSRIVDWGWATRGAPWLDAAYWVIWLIAAGHTPTDAETHAATIDAWHKAPQRGIDAFAAANARLWRAAAGPKPDAFTAPLATAARMWQEYRRSRQH